jgi:hypothetical protein
MESVPWEKNETFGNLGQYKIWVDQMFKKNKKMIYK